MATVEASPQRSSPLYAGALGPAWALLRAGRIRATISLLESLELDTTAAELPGPRLALLLTCQLAVGDLSAARSSGEGLSSMLALSPESELFARLGLGELAAALGDHPSALEHFQLAGCLPGSDNPDLPPWRAGAVMALVHAGRRSEAVALAREQVTAAERSSDPHALAIALRTLATTDASINPVKTLRRARELAHGSGDLRLTTQIDTDLAGLTLLMPSSATPAADPSGSSALAMLREAEIYAVGEGLWPLHTRISQLLDRAGAPSQPVDGDPLSCLTEAEQRVALLAARGLTNRQIADRLAVAVKSVEWHLSRVYRKLGIGSRAGLGEIRRTSPLLLSETSQTS